jgi:hypothetical protein
MYEVLLLVRSHVNICALRIGQCLYAGRFGGVVVDVYIIHGHAGEVLNTGFQVVGQAGPVFSLRREDRDVSKRIAQTGAMRRLRLLVRGDLPWNRDWCRCKRP